MVRVNLKEGINMAVCPDAWLQSTVGKYYKYYNYFLLFLNWIKDLKKNSHTVTEVKQYLKRR